MVLKDLDVLGEVKANIPYLYVVCISVAHEARTLYQSAKICREF